MYGVWKETSGEYDPKDDKPIVDPRGNVHTQNETKFKYWAMEQYGMTSEEYRGYTVEGALKTLGEIDEATSKTMLILALPSIAKNAVKTVKDVAENGVHFDTSIGFAASDDTTKKIANNRELMTGEDWNDYFREKYGYDNVNWDTAFSSPNDIIDTPSSITRMNPNGLHEYLNKNGIETKSLRYGHLKGVSYEEGGGFNGNFYSKDYPNVSLKDYGESYVQYHPGDGHYGKGAYYKVSSNNKFSYTGKETGTQRFYLDGTVIKNE